MSFLDIHLERCFLNETKMLATNCETLEFVKTSGDLFALNILNTIGYEANCSVHFLQQDELYKRFGYTKNLIKTKWRCISHYKYLSFQYYLGSFIKDRLNFIREETPKGKVLYHNFNGNFVILTTRFRMEGPSVIDQNFKTPAYGDKNYLIKIFESNSLYISSLKDYEHLQDADNLGWFTLSTYLMEDYEERQNLKYAINKLDVREILKNL